MMKKGLMLIWALILTTGLVAQVQLPPAAQATITAELKKRGLSEQEVRERLEKEGIDVNNIRVEDLPRVQRRVEEIIDEMTKEKALKERLNVPSNASEEEEELPEPSNRRVPKSERLVNAFDSLPNASSRGLSMSQDSMPQALKKKNKLAEKEDKEEKKGLFDTQNKQNKGKTDYKEVEAILGLADTTLLPIDSVDVDAVFGQNAFKDSRTVVFTDPKTIRATDNYLLGTGDKVTIGISGVAYFNQTYEINKDGYIQPDRMPRMYIKGMSLGQAKKNLASSFRVYYPFRTEDFTVAVNEMRQVVVNVVGEVEQPGSFKLSGSNTAFNALAAAGGPTKIGSLRNVVLIRATGERKAIDLYAYLADPSVARDLFIYDNDYISVPVAQRIIQVQGAVRRPFRYELLDSEHLIKALELAGGFADRAYSERLQIKRLVNGKEVVIDVNYAELKAKKGDFNLQNGDQIVVKEVINPENAAVEVLGAVEQPGKYEITKGMKLSDLVAKAKLRQEARTDIAYLQRTNADKTMQLKLVNLAAIAANPTGADNVELRAQDRLLVYSLQQYSRKDSVFIDGAVRSALRFPFDASRSMRVSDLVNLAGGLTPEATDFAYIKRQDANNPKLVEYKRVALKIALERPEAPENIILAPNDVLTIQSRELFYEEANVNVSGAVRNPGSYKWDESLSLQDVLTLAGGLKLEAASNRIDVFRIQIRDNQEVKTVVTTVEVDKDLIIKNTAANFRLEPYDQIVVRSIPSFSFQRMINVVGEVRYPGAYALVGINERLSSVVKRAGSLTPEAFPSGATLYRQQDNIGYVVIDLTMAMKDTTSYQNIVLKEGDILEIPRTKDLVAIQGATRARELYPDKVISNGRINVAFEGEKSAWYYVSKYGAGLGKEGRSKLISVEYPNGQIKRTKDYVLFKKYPTVAKGSVVTVGTLEKKEKEKGIKKDIDWNKVLADAVAQATALLSFIILIQRLN